MDFVARAGSVVDKWQRVAGILLILCLVEAWMILSQMETNEQLQLDYKVIREEAKVYVVPGSAAGFYTPPKPEFLLKEMTYLILHSLNTYTYSNLEEQYKEIEKFFDERMLTSAQGHFGKLINQAYDDERSALFIPITTSYKVKQEQDESGEEIYVVKAEGTVRYIISDAVVEAAPIEFTLRFKRRHISPTNPFGFVLVSYKQKELTSQEITENRQARTGGQ